LRVHLGQPAFPARHLGARRRGATPGRCIRPGRNVGSGEQKYLYTHFAPRSMAERMLTRSVELKAGEHAVVELGELSAGARITGSLKDARHDKFLYVIVDEDNHRRFMLSDSEADEEEGELMVLAEGDGRGHYQVDAEAIAAGKHYLIIESEAAALKRKIKVNLRIL